MALPEIWYGPVAGSCEQLYEILNSIKNGEFFDQLSDYQIPQKEYAPSD
jgi:hypothetical protein